VIKNDVLRDWPAQRLKAVDGMAVTADVWEEAHTYHRQQQRLHALWQHGPGIIAGLEIIASDPPDNFVYVLPGLALDSQGQTIVVAEPLSFDLGNSSDGLLHVLLTYGEGRPRLKEGQVSAEGAAYFIRSEFNLEATETLPEGPYVELARIHRDRAAPIRNAAMSLRPRANEIDLRYRTEVGAPARAPLTIGVCVHTEGALRLAQALRGPMGGQQPVWVDEIETLPTTLDDYTMLYLVAHDTFALAPEQMTAIYNYWQTGGTVFFEACQRHADAQARAHAAFATVLEAYGARPETIGATHPIFSTPHFFPALPIGYANATSGLKWSDGIFINASDYGCLWNGQQNDQPATREVMRSGYEFGQNLLAIAQARRSAMRAA